VATEPAPAETTVRALFAAFAARDAEAALPLLHPAVEFWPQATGERSGRTEPYRGHDGFRAYLVDVARVWDAFEVEPADWRVAGDGVVCFGEARARARGDDVTQRLPVIWVFRLRGGLVAYCRVVRTAAEATALAAEPAGGST
jgi:ketosteroid isomerase-like protein